jgi:hypothetical protein
VLDYLLASRGYHDVELTPLHPDPEDMMIHEDSEAARRLNLMLYGPQDIAAFARRL